MSAPAAPRGPALSRLLEELARVEPADLPDRFAPGLPAGAAVGRFVVEREIGRGGFGVVYAARDPELGRSVALKLLRPGIRVASAGEDWMRREAEAVARLHHPGIVTLHDFGRAPEGAYLVFELLEGETLAERARRGPLPLGEVLRVGAAVAEALAHAHRAGVLHQDLTPANVFLCAPAAGGPGRPTVKVLDFGVAHLFGRERGASGGTPGYTAPEQRAGDPVDPRADLYALGAVLHRLLAGEPLRGEEGAPPALPRAVAPARLRRLVAALTAAEPGARPGSADAVAEALERMGRAHAGRWRGRALGGLAAATFGALLLAGWALRRGEEAAPGERLAVVVADVDDRTGDPDLAGLGEGLRALLGASRRVVPLGRDRLAAVARQAGLPPPARLDEAGARELARLAGADAVLVPSARRGGGAVRLGLRAASPEDGRALFELAEEALEKAEVPAALDRLLAQARARLRERREDLRAAPIHLARMATADLTAYRHYLEGLDCVARPSAGPADAALARCAPHFERALALDPAFPLAHYQLAFLLSQAGSTPAELEAHVRAALAGADRLSARDAALVRAFQAHLEGRDEEAERVYDRLLAAHPADRELLYLAGDVRFHREDRVGAIPYFQKALALDPDAEWPLEHLLDSYAVTGRRQELAALAADLAAGPLTAERSRVRVRALAWLGRREESIAAARRGVAAGLGPSAEADLAGALIAAGRFEEAEPLLEARLRREGPASAGRVPLAAVWLAQGRVERARALVERPPRDDASLPPDERHFLEALLDLAEGARARFAGEVEKVAELGAPDESYLATLAVLEALAGDPARARAFAPRLGRWPAARDEVAALLKWRAGEAGAAAAALTAVEAREPWPVRAVAPSFLLAEVSASQGEWREAVAWAERYRQLWPRGAVRGWLWPRALYLSALGHARLGQREVARSELARLRALLRRAEPGLPLARDAQRLEREVEGRGRAAGRS